MENDLRFLWDAAPIGLAKVSRDGKFISVNPRFAEMVGYSASELAYNKTFQQITHPDDLDADVSEAEALAADPEKRHYQKIVVPCGSVYVFLLFEIPKTGLCTSSSSQQNSRQLMFLPTIPIIRDFQPQEEQSPSWSI